MNQSLQASTDRRPHAVPSDFCAIFEQDMSALYSLAFLLTGRRRAAEQCVLDALEDCRAAADVFPEWARSWSRRAVIKQAIQGVHPRPGDAGAPEQEAMPEADEYGGIPRRLLQLAPFERFVFAMGVLERYSLHECATLLGCHVRHVDLARIAALKALGASREEHGPNPWAGERKQHAAVA
jgi:DNA-directed RNA polymerase specialized sigma24 family protein